MDNGVIKWEIDEQNFWCKEEDKLEDYNIYIPLIYNGAFKAWSSTKLVLLGLSFRPHHHALCDTVLVGQRH